MRLSFFRKKAVAPPKSPYAEEHRLLAVYLEQSYEFRERHGVDYAWGYEPKSVGITAEILDRKGDRAGAMVTAIAERLLSVPIVRGTPSLNRSDTPYLYVLNNAISKRQPTFTVQQACRIVELSLNNPTCAWMFGKDRLTTILLNTAKTSGLTDELRATIKSLLKTSQDTALRHYLSAEDRRNFLRLQAILDCRDPNVLPMNEPWQTPLAEMGQPYNQIVAFFATAKGTGPSAKWRAQAETLLAKTDAEELLGVFESAIAGVRKMERPVDAGHADMLRGFCWMVGLIKSPRSAFLIGEMLIACNHKLTGSGARSQKGFSACVIALENMGEIYALAELSKARAKVKTPSLADMLLKTLNRAAEKQNVPLAELEEIILPTFGLDAPGRKEFEFGDASVLLEIAGTSSVVLNWSKGGKPLKSAPANIKTEFKKELTELTQLKKEIESALSAQKNRLESLFMIDRAWPYALWRERHIDHPLMANMTRRLVWRFSTNKGDFFGIATDGVPLDIEGNPIPGLDEGAEVRLWHPLDAGVSVVEAWREYIVGHEIRQPFKQAHREIYILTDAERATGAYSNRFAAHVLKQHQCAALMRGRGWRYQLQGWFDFQSTPTLNLPDHNLSAEFFVATSDQDPSMMTSDSGIATYVVTDQVRFLDGAGTPVDLDQVPPKVFSEVFRDVDLFVGVCSVGNDPAWYDQGERMGFGAYWQSFSFGDLSATAETRKAILERLLPRLSIANVSHIDGKFLVVKGKRRTYKIHLGSGNILMEPNDQYLCIVPAPDREHKADSIYLPFEGDRTMAVILSKAMMLAEDDKITDRTILTQLAR